MQLADLLASSINTIFIRNIIGLEDEFANEILKSNLAKVTGNQMWPTKAVTPEQLNMLDTSGRNALDFIADVEMQKPEAYSKTRPSGK